jgi:hypothetical protein
MKGKFHIGAPIIVFGAAVVAAVLLAKTPWSTEEAAGGVVEYRFCDLVFEGPPPGQTGVAILRQYSPQPTLTIKILEANRSEVILDENGRPLEEHYANSEARSLIAAVVASKEAAPLEADWPYTNASQYAPVYVHEEGPGAKFRMPDAGSGLAVSDTYGDGPGFFSYSIKLSACNSEKEVAYRSDETEPKVTIDRVQSQDQEAFDTFFSEVEFMGWAR